jgi:hypothetical protein
MPSRVSPLRALLYNKRTFYPLFVIPLLAIVLLAATLTLYHYNFARAVSADTLVSFPGTIPPAVAHSKLVGQADPQQTISLSVGLHLRNEEALKSYVTDITLPNLPIIIATSPRHRFKARSHPA